MKLTYLILGSILLSLPLSKSAESCTHTFGVYWGTFDPPTLAHQAIIRQAFSFGIERLFVIINNHGHKPYCASIADRLAMLKSTIDPKLSVTVLVQDRTCAWGMQELKNRFGRYPETAWYLFSGQENLAYWDIKKCDPHDTIVIVERKGATTKIPESIVQLVLAEISDFISSTAVRTAIKQKSTTWYSLVPHDVAAFITEHALYS